MIDKATPTKIQPFPERGYELRTELWSMGNGPGDMVEMVSAYTPEGHYIGDAETAEHLWKKYQIVPELREPSLNVCSIGKSQKDGKWYGWSHRAIASFGVGDEIEHEDGTTSKLLTDYDAREAAASFAREVASALLPGPMLSESSETLLEGVFDPYTLKAVFLSGGGGSGKSHVSRAMFSGMGLKFANSDAPLERLAAKQGLDLRTQLGTPAGQALRDKGKQLAKDTLDGWVESRLGLIIDGTASDVEKVMKQKAALESAGYDTAMVFVNTSLPVALARNAGRGRVVPPDVLTRDWQNVQKFKEVYRSAFAPYFREIINDKSNTPEEMIKDVIPQFNSVALQLVGGPVRNPLGRAWFKRELETVPDNLKGRLRSYETTTSAAVAASTPTSVFGGTPKKKRRWTDVMTAKVESALFEGIFDPYILKAVFLGGGMGSGKSFIGQSMFAGMGLKFVGSDVVFEYLVRKAGLDLHAFLDETPQGKALRMRARELTGASLETLIANRLGIIVDSTASDINRVMREKDAFERAGYDTAMVFVNTPLDVAVARAAERERNVHPETVKKFWEMAQVARAHYSRAFGGRYVEIENSKRYSGSDIAREVVPALHSAALKLISGPVMNPIGREWMRAVMGDLTPAMRSKVLGYREADKLLDGGMTVEALIGA